MGARSAHLRRHLAGRADINIRGAARTSRTVSLVGNLRREPLSQDKAKREADSDDSEARSGGSMRLDAPIRELVFCDGQRMTLNRDSIVVFVGPNNAGKTSCLRDIYALLSDEPHLGLIESINFEKPSISDIKALLGEASVKVQDPSLHYDGMGFKVYA